MSAYVCVCVPVPVSVPEMCACATFVGKINWANKHQIAQRMDFILRLRLEMAIAYHIKTNRAHIRTFHCLCDFARLKSFRIRM